MATARPTKAAATKASAKTTKAAAPAAAAATPPADTPPAAPLPDVVQPVVDAAPVAEIDPADAPDYVVLEDFAATVHGCQMVKFRKGDKIDPLLGQQLVASGRVAAVPAGS